MSAVQRDVVTLVRNQRWAALGTLHDGQPMVSMVSYVVEPDLGGLLIFVSQLAGHTRALIEHPYYSMAISEADTGSGDPQLLPRVTLSGGVEMLTRDTDAFAEAARRYVARFPDAEMRFQLGDFVMMRLSCDAARYVGGFARAATFTGAQLQETARTMPAA